MTVEEGVDAAGALVWRLDPADRTGRDVQVAVVHRPRYDDWSLPKGTLEPGESSRVTASREVLEETGFLVAVGRHLGQVHYPVTRPRRMTKSVDYYAARLTGVGQATDAGHDGEVDELRWCSPEEAAELLSHRQDARIVSAFTALPPDLTTLLLVRHAKAGSRAQWEGPDEERPLSENGRRQLPPIQALARLYGVDRVFSAPLVRCVDTVAQIADEAGVPVRAEPLLSEEAYQGEAARAAERLLEIAAGGGTPLVCSQGGVIPDLLSRVAGDLPLPMRRLESKKASVWALFFAMEGDQRLVGAEYVRKP